MTGVAVIVPVHDEEGLLERCLRSVRAAVDAAGAAHPDLAIAVVVVLDACRDRSREIAVSSPVTVLEIDAHAVGAARRAGVRRALDELGAHDVWIANTDADSAVPENWLTCQLALMAGGADVVLGTVRPDFADLTPQHAAYWTATHPPGRPLGDVFGANLGVRASVYREVGGFTAIAEHEDVHLVERAVAAGVVVRASDAAEVLTSGRPVGRTPGGYAAFVRGVHERLSGGCRTRERGRVYEPDPDGWCGR